VVGLGRPATSPFSFEDPASFGTYWNRLLRHHTAPYCIATVRRVRVRRLDDDIAVARFQLVLQMNTSLWLFLVLVALIVAVIVDLATRTRVTAELEKILVRVGDEWHLYDGAWQGVEEEDSTWLASSGEPAGSS